MNDTHRRCSTTRSRLRRLRRARSARSLVVSVSIMCGPEPAATRGHHTSGSTPTTTTKPSTAAAATSMTHYYREHDRSPGRDPRGATTPPRRRPPPPGAARPAPAGVTLVSQPVWIPTGGARDPATPARRAQARDSDPSVEVHRIASTLGDHPHRVDRAVSGEWLRRTPSRGSRPVVVAADQPSPQLPRRLRAPGFRRGPNGAASTAPACTRSRSGWSTTARRITARSPRGWSSSTRAKRPRRCRNALKRGQSAQCPDRLFGKKRLLLSQYFFGSNASALNTLPT